MVEISSIAVSRSALSSSTSTLTTKKPTWLLAIYALFILVCLNAVRTYLNQKRSLQLKISESELKDSLEIHYGGAAEEHVVSSNYGSSMYGGFVHAKKKNSIHTHGTRLSVIENVLPKASDGSNDYAGNHSDFNGFSFYVLTDTPYTDRQEKRLRSQMADLRDYSKDNPQRNISLGLHLGDTQKVSNSLCAESAYKRVSYLITKGPRPTFVVPGNNDWYDCPRREEAFGFFMNHFGPDFVSRWHSEHSINLNIQRSEDNPELFKLYVEGILFIGVHMIDAPLNTESTKLRDERMKTSLEWLAKSVETDFAKREIRGAIIIGHAGWSERNKLFFTHMSKYFANVNSREKVPVVYLHGDGLTYKVDRTFSEDIGWDYFHDVQIEQSGLADPVIFDVAPQQRGNMQGFEEDDSNDMITTFGKGLFRLDHRQGRYTDPVDITR